MLSCLLLLTNKHGYYEAVDASAQPGRATVGKRGHVEIQLRALSLSLSLSLFLSVVRLLARPSAMRWAISEQTAHVMQQSHVSSTIARVPP